MTYEPNFPDFKSAGPEDITLIIRTNGSTHLLTRPLSDAFINAQGPISLESGCLAALREMCRDLCQEIWKERQCNG